MALSDLFAPAYIRSDPNSVQRVNDWQAQNFGMTNQGVEATRAPVGFNTGNPAGMVDPEALRQLAQGGPRNAIAAQVTAAPAPAAPAPSGYTPKYLPNGTLDPNDPGNIAQYYLLMGGGGGGAAPAPAASSAPAAPTAAPAAWAPYQYTSYQGGP
jgi:hypothetical protein